MLQKQIKYTIHPLLSTEILFILNDLNCGTIKLSYDNQEISPYITVFKQNTQFHLLFSLGMNGGCDQ